jgi:hypothetical protein
MKKVVLCAALMLATGAVMAQTKASVKPEPGKTKTAAPATKSTQKVTPAKPSVKATSTPTNAATPATPAKK